MEIARGMEIPEWRLELVSPEKMKLFSALSRDPAPIHFDRRAVAKQGLGERLINQGPISLGYVVNMLHDWAGPGSLRAAALRLTAIVFDGDAVVASGVVIAVREEGGEHLADCEVWLETGDGTRAVTGTATVVLPG